MDTCFSNLKELFHGSAYPYSYSLDDLARHYTQASSWIDYWQRTVPQSVAVIQYEDLVSEPARVLAGVQQFLGLTLQEDLHEITRNETPVATASSSQVREEVNRRGVGAWKKYQTYLGPLADQLDV